MSGFLSVFNPLTLLLIVFGSVLGIIFGAIPGLSGTMAVALCLPFTYAMDTTNGISLLLALYFGGVSGGLIASVLLRIPGTPGSVATIWDGGKMAENGQPGRALGLGIFYSFIGSVFGVLCMAFIAPQIAAVARSFGPCEYFAVIFFALTLISSLSDGSMLKALISGCIGLAVAMIGIAPMDSAKRFTFGNPNLNNGFALISMMIGFFAIAEIFSSAGSKAQTDRSHVKFKMKGLGFTLREFVETLPITALASVIGLGIGILPGIGASTSNIIASETSNNACCGGTLIPLVALGIPGDACTAIVLGGLMIHGVVPGPQMFATNGDLIYAMVAAMLIASVAIFALQYFAIHFFVRMLSIPKNILLSIVACLCVVGAYADNNRIFDVYAILLFGVLGYVFRKLDIPTTPFMLGFILENYMETYLRRALATYSGNVGVFFTRPISCVFILVGIVSMVWRILKNVRNEHKKAA